MLFFQNDYGQGCIEEILTMLAEANDQAHPGYGMDSYNKNAAELIASEIGRVDCDIHFVVSGTLCNLNMIRHILKSYQGVVSPESGHINVHEAGAVEATGHKIIQVPSSNGKITLSALEKVCEEADRMKEHMVMPKAVYISNATEVGTVYTREELESLSKYCHEHNLYLIMDGARIGNALTSGVDYTLKDLAQWLDLFSIGITKNGALFGEAVILVNEHLKKDFRYTLKQSGALLPKGWLLGLQFIAMFTDGKFYECARHANEMAMEIQDWAVELDYPLYTKSTTNQVFPVLSAKEYEYLKQEVSFEVWEIREDSYICRLVTSWHTTRAEVRSLKNLLVKAKNLEKTEDKE